MVAPTEVLTEDGREETVAPTPQRVAEAARRQLGVHGRTIMTLTFMEVMQQADVQLYA